MGVAEGESCMGCILRRFSRRKQFDGSEAGDSKLDRCLTTLDLTALGIGSTLGVGIYVLSGAVAKDVSGPSIILSFLIAGFASALSGICYAELGCRVPKAGSAYAYSYTAVGELVAFIIGWNLVLEYTIGVASVARGYSGYLDSMMNKSMTNAFEYYMPMHVSFLSPYPDFTAFAITALVTLILAIGVKESTRFNNVFTGLNLCVVVFVTVLGFIKANPENWNLPPSAIPSSVSGGQGGFFPFGISGTLSGAATCFFGYVGFDCIATSGEETKNPQKSIPIAICLSLFAVFLAYFGVSSALTLMVPYYAQDADAPLSHAFHAVGWPAVGYMVSIGALFGLSTSLLGAMFPLPRVLYAMASDGIIFRYFSVVHPSTQTPLRATIVSGVFSGLMATIFDLQKLVDMMSIGTLMAYTIVAACVILLRYQDLSNMGAAKAHEYMALGNLSERSKVIRSDSDDDDSEDEEIVYCRSDDLDSSAENNERENLNLAKPDFDSEITSLRELFSALLNTNRDRAPNSVSSSLSSWLTIIFSILATICASLLQAEDRVQSVGLSLFLGLVIFFMVLCLLFLSMQPKTTQVLTFKVPFVPLLPGVSIFVNIYLMCKLSMGTWVRFLVWMVAGFAIYFGYGWRNSSEEYRMKGQKPPEH